MIELRIKPMPAPRQSRSDLWNPRECVLRYRAYRDELRLRCREAGYEQGDTLDAVFVLPMPSSWSKKKRDEMRGTPHMVKPDTDNIVKGVLDAFLKQDGFVWKIAAEKRWGDVGTILLRPH